MTTTAEPRLVPEAGGSKRQGDVPVSPKRVKLAARHVLHNRAMELLAETGKLQGVVNVNVSDYLAAVRQAGRESSLGEIGEVEAEGGR